MLFYLFGFAKSEWVNTDKITHSDGNFFGRSIAFSSNHLVVGAPRDNNQVGAIYLYDYDSESGKLSEGSPKSYKPDSSNGRTNFGKFVTISSDGSFILASADSSSDNGEVMKCTISGGAITPKSQNGDAENKKIGFSSAISPDKKTIAYTGFHISDNKIKFKVTFVQNPFTATFESEEDNYDSESTYYPYIQFTSNKELIFSSLSSSSNVKNAFYQISLTISSTSLTITSVKLTFEESETKNTKYIGGPLDFSSDNSVLFPFFGQTGTDTDFYLPSGFYRFVKSETKWSTKPNFTIKYPSTFLKDKAIQNHIASCGENYLVQTDMYSNIAGEGNGAVLFYSRENVNDSYIFQNILLPPDSDTKDKTYLKFGSSVAWNSDCSALFISAESQNPKNANQPEKNAYVYVYQSQDTNKIEKNNADVIGPIFIGIFLFLCLAALAAFFLYHIHKKGKNNNPNDPNKLGKL